MFLVTASGNGIAAALPSTTWLSSCARSTQPAPPCSSGPLPSPPLTQDEDEDKEPSPYDSRPPLHHVELQYMPDRLLIFHECSSNEDKWDPLQFASDNPPLITAQLFGGTNEIHILQEIWLEAFNSLLHLIENIKRSGYSCYHKLSCSQLVMINNRFELRNGVPLMRASWSSFQRDYHGGGEVMEQIMNHVYGPGAMEKVPDLKCLVQSMKDPTEPKGYPILVDPSLMPLHNKGPATIDVYNFLKFEVPIEFHQDLLKGLVYTMNSWWITIVKQNDLLWEWFDGSLSPYDSESGTHFLAYLRHSYSHLMDYRLALQDTLSRITGKKIRKKYSKQHAQLVLYGSFRLALQDLYRKLWRKGKLKMLNPHLYFRYSR